MLSGFKQFILKGNVVDLAVGVVMGVAFNGVVSSLVKDLITPIIGLIGGQPDFSRYQFQIGKSTFLVGEFFNAVITLLIDALVIYFFVVLPVNKLLELSKRDKKTDPADKKCPFCLSDIPLEAKKCKFCTSSI